MELEERKMLKKMEWQKLDSSLLLEVIFFAIRALMSYSGV